MVPKDQENELMHYGVLGMKWGVHRALSKAKANERLRKKASKYDKKAATMTKKSEKIHTRDDLEGAYKKGVKAAQYDKKAATLYRKSLTKTSEFEQARLHKKSEKLKYKAANLRRESNRITKSQGYSFKAMKYSIKSDKAAALAAKARMKMTNNEYYIKKMKRKASQISQEDRDRGYAFIDRLKDI